MKKYTLAVLVAIAALMILAFSATLASASSRMTATTNSALVETPHDWFNNGTSVQNMVATVASSAVGSYLPSARDVRCIANAMYFEARGEGDIGMLAVGHVILNRVNDDRFPKTVCEVVRQGTYVEGKLKNCQFSYVCDGRPKVIAEKHIFQKAMKLAEEILTGEAPNPVQDSLFFRASHLHKAHHKPGVVVGNHHFYTEYWGSKTIRSKGTVVQNHRA